MIRFIYFWQKMEFVDIDNKAHNQNKDKYCARVISHLFIRHSSSKVLPRVFESKI